MDYGRPELADRLAAEYVLGTLRGPARRRFQALLGAHPALRSAVRRWEEQLTPLAGSVAPVAPPEQVWTGIETRLFPAAAVASAAAPPGWWNRLGLWRGFSALATTAAVALLMVATQVPAPQAPIVVVLATNPAAAQAVPASFVASLSADGRHLAYVTNVDGRFELRFIDTRTGAAGPLPTTLPGHFTASWNQRAGSRGGGWPVALSFSVKPPFGRSWSNT